MRRAPFAMHEGQGGHREPYEMEDFWVSSLMVQHAAIEGFWLDGFSADVREMATRIHVSPIAPFE